MATLWCIIRWGMANVSCILHRRMATHWCKIHLGVALKIKNKFHCVRYTAEWQLHGVSYTAEYIFWGVSYTTEAIAKQIKAITAFKGTLLQKIYQNFKFLSYSMMTMNLKFFKVCSIQSTPLCILHHGNDFIFEYFHEYLAKIKIVPVYLLGWNNF